MAEVAWRQGEGCYPDRVAGSYPDWGLVAAAAAGTIIQLMNTNNISADMLAVRQVQTAGDWVSRDGVQAQSADNISDNISTGLGMPFTLKWSYWDTGASPPVNETHQVTYSLVNMPSGSLKQLQRHEVVKDKNGVTISDTYYHSGGIYR